MDPVVYHEIREIIIECGHQFSKTRTVALRYLNDLVSSFPSLLCHQVVITALLEMLTLLRRSCLSEFTDEVSRGLRQEVGFCTRPTKSHWPMQPTVHADV